MPTNTAEAKGETTLVQVPLTKLIPSPWNPRKHYDSVALAELRDSIKAHGILMPLLVRPAGKHFEIAGGERRYRAAMMAADAYKEIHLLDAPCLVREMTDAEFLEVVNLDNLQRANLHPMEEAQGFHLLITKAAYDPAKIASKLNRSSDYVYDRLQLLKLVPNAQHLFVTERISLGHATLISRQPRELQEQIITLASDRRSQSGPLWTSQETGGLFDDWKAITPSDETKAVTVLELQGWINKHVRFDPKAADALRLFPDAVGKIAEAKTAQRKTVCITFSQFTQLSARTDEKMYGPSSWMLADGSPQGKTCALSALGVVVAGPRRGDAFLVCVEREKCLTHYGADIRRKKKLAADRRAADAGDSKAKKKVTDHADRWAAQNALAARQRKILDLVEPRLVEKLAIVIRSSGVGALLVTGAIGAFVMECAADGRWFQQVKTLPKIGASTDSMIRYLAEAYVRNPHSTDELFALATALKLDTKTLVAEATKEVDAVAPAAEKTPTSKKTLTKKKDRSKVDLDDEGDLDDA